jgi:serine/threonine-protein kinase
VTPLESTPIAIGKYRLIASLGAGGMAQVYLAVASGPAGFNKLLVLKLLRPELAQDRKFFLMFLDEARLAARLNHPNVVQTYEVGEEGDQTFLAMEYLEGQPWSAVLRKLGRGPVPLTAHVRLLCDMLAGLHHAHELCDFDGTPLRVVHRDVSPQNVMLTYDGVVKLMDFGIAAASTASQVTETGTFKGKAAYAAPEQIRGEKVDRRADLFAVGVMLWEALAARKIAEGKQDIQTMHQRIAGLDPPIDDVAPDTPAELRAICSRAMSPEPAARYPSAREMQQALLSWLQAQPPSSLGDLVSEAFREEHQRLRNLIDEAIKRSREQSVLTSLPQLSSTLSGTPSNGTPSPASHLTPSLAIQSPSLVPPSRRSPWLLPGLLGVLLLGALGVALLKQKEPAPAPLPAASAPLPAVSSAPPAPTPSAPASPPSAPLAAPSAAPAAFPASASAEPAALPRPAAPARTDRTAPPVPTPEPPRPDSKPGKKPKRPIDDSDPYAR